MVTRAGFLIAALVAVSAAQAQSTPPSATGTDPSAASTPHQRHATAGAKANDPKLRMAMEDGAIPATFVKKAALDGMTEVELGKMALTKSQDPKVRQFAERMVKDHTKANTELASLASRKSLEVPKALDAEHQSVVQAMNSKSGTAFDTAYGEHMAEDHAKAVALFQGASHSSDKDLASFAQKTLPTLEDHEKMTQSLPGPRTADTSSPSSKKE